MDLNRLFFKYCIYYPVVILRGEWIYPFLRFYRKSQFWPVQKLEDLQLEKLNRLLKHAKKTVPAYQHLPDKIESLSELASLPLLEKEDIRDRFEEYLSSQQSLRFNDKTSGGSTGAPVTVRKDNRSMAQELAATWRGYEWAGVGVGDRQARFWGVPQIEKAKSRAKLIDAVTNRRRISAFNFSQTEMTAYYNELLRFKPKYFYGYVSMLREFAFYCGPEKGKALQLEAIISTSEVLNQTDRKLLEQTFAAKVYNEYGCGEVGTIAHECEHGALHINTENMVLEVVNEKGELVGEGEVGEFIVTELNNLSMPLIRYRMKDFGSISKSKCKCGRTLPVINEIGGREYDMLINSEGKKFHGEFFLYIIEDLKKNGVITKGVQFVQESHSKIVVNIAMENSLAFNSAGEYIRKQIFQKFDPDAIVDIVYLDHIAREPSGKLRVVKRLSF